MDKKEPFQAFFTPQHITVIGASNKEGKMGNLFVRRLLDRFPGKISLVHIATTLEDLMYAVRETASHPQRSFFFGKPLYICWASPYDLLKNMRILEERRIPCYQSTLETVRVAAAICNYAMQSVEGGF